METTHSHLKDNGYGHGKNIYNIYYNIWEAYCKMQTAHVTNKEGDESCVETKDTNNTFIKFVLLHLSFY